MIPVPKAQHALAIVLFAAVAAFAAVLVWKDRDTTDEQVNVAVNVLRAEHPDWYAQDPVFGTSGLWRFSTPVWDNYLRLVYRITGNALAPFRLLVGPLVLLYLLGMYCLLWQQCKSWSVACYTAILSTAMIFVMGRSYWGLGTLSSMSAETIYLAFIPLLVWLFLRWIDSAMVLWAFLAAGLLANIHVVTGMNLTLVLMITYLGHQRFRLPAWGMALLGGLCAAGAASPCLWQYFAARAALGLAGGPSDWSIVARAFERGDLTVLYPVMLVDTLDFVGYTLVLWVPAVVVLLRWERFRARNLLVWVWMLLACVLVGLVFHGISQLVGLLRGEPPPVIDFVHALRFSLLPLYVLFAQAVVHLLRLRVLWLSRGVRIALGILMMVWMIPSYNLRLPRHWVEAVASSTMEEENRPEAVMRRWIHRQQDDELMAISNWLASNTPPGAVLAGQDARLRLWAHRSLVACATDVKYYYYMAPNLLEGWSKLIEQQRRVLQPPYGGPAEEQTVVQFAREHGASFIVIEPESAPRSPETLVRVRISTPGRYWQLYYVPSGPSTETAPAKSALTPAYNKGSEGKLRPSATTTAAGES